MRRGALEQARRFGMVLGHAGAFQVHERKRNLRPHMLLLGSLAIPDRGLLEIDRHATALIIDITEREFARGELLVGRGLIPSQRCGVVLCAPQLFLVHVAKHGLRLGLAGFSRSRYPAKSGIDISGHAGPMREYQVVGIRCLVAQPNGGRLAPGLRPVRPELGLDSVQKDQAELKLRLDVAELRRSFVPHHSVRKASRNPLVLCVKHSDPVARFGIAGLRCQLPEFERLQIPTALVSG